MILAKIDIKGVNNCLVFVFSNGTVEEYTELLKNRFENKPQLFNGSPVLFRGEGLQRLTHLEVSTLQRLCLDHGMILHNVHVPDRKAKVSGDDLIIYKTLRSGQKLHSEGSMIIWGNVHESAEVSAAKDVIVLGRLEGIAHAGCYGDAGSSIFALNLSPKQLRIGDRISRAPGDFAKNPVPAVAYTEGDNIYIKEYSFK